MSGSAEIYGLYCPNSGDLKYIGKANCSKKRLAGHLLYKKKRTPLYDWIGALRDAGRLPIMRVLLVCEERDWPEYEIKFIEYYRSKGKLLNLADGGNQPSPSKEQRQANALKLNELRKNDPEFRRIYDAKRRLGSAVRELEKAGRHERAEKLKATMRECARKRPDLFGKWAAL